MKNIQLIFVLLLLAVACKSDQKKDLKSNNNNNVQYNNPGWADELIEAYKAFNNGRNLESANLVFNASEKMPIKNWENYLVSAMVFSEEGNLEKSYLSIEKSIEYGLKDTELLNSIPEFNALKDSKKWQELILQTNRKKEEYLSNIQNPKLFKELEYLWSKDQQALSEYEQKISLLDSTATLAKYNELFKSVEERWQINKTKLDSIIAIYGWPNNHLVGEDGSKIAWSIAQHHPDIFFKKKCLMLMEEEIAQGNINPNLYAELTDRIARDTWQKQTYGASMGTEEPYPIANVLEVNKRRFELGLPEPIEVYALYHGISFEIPSEEKVEEKYLKAQSDYKKFESSLNSKKIDSSIVYLRKAIEAHGDISNEQLFESAKKLAKTNNRDATRLSIDILKVLIWREWERRFDIVKVPEFTSLKNSDRWSKIIKSLEESKL